MLYATDANGSGGSAVVKALRATEKRMEKSLRKNKKMNDSSTNVFKELGGARSCLTLPIFLVVNG
ncbi:MAG: hypothetical protein K6G44_06665 [Lentisphaeria bacterium]|nr:hypothetical protein [Lentisphaeria bacterium]